MERLSGRFADIFSWLYLGTATLRRFEADGHRKEDLPFVHWSVQHAFAQIQQGFEGLYGNMGWFFRGPVACWARLNSIGSVPSDKIGAQVARSLQKPGAQRDALTAGMFIPTDPNEALGRLENAFRLVSEAEAITKKIMKAVRAGQLSKDKPERLVEKAVEVGIILQQEAELVARAEKARNDTIQVDSFTQAEYMNETPLAPPIKRVA